MTDDRCRWTALAGVMTWLALSAGLLFAQTTPPTSAAAPATRPALAEASQDRLLAELATRRLRSLLDRAYETDRVPSVKRRAFDMMLRLSELADPAARIGDAQRREALAQIAAGLDPAVDRLADPGVLWDQSALLIQTGVTRPVNTLEYWGENPRTQAELRPIVDCLLRMLQRAHDLARAQADQLAANLTGADDPAVHRYAALDQLAMLADYTRHMVQYYQVLSIDSKTAADQRRRIATEAIDGLAEFDNTQSTVQPVVRNRIAKLRLAIGQFDIAAKIFASVVQHQTDPKPALAQEYEARYFSVLCDLMAGKLDAAQTGLAELRAWQATALAHAIQSARDGADAAAAMLEYRLASAQAAQATSDAARQAADARARAVLMSLLQTRPDLRGIIYEQLATRISGDTDLSTLDTLMLEALIQRGSDQLRLPEAQPVDAPVVRRAIAAARELVRRRSEGVDRDLVDRTALLLGFLLARVNDNADAAEAFLDYIRDFPLSKDNTSVALDNARALIGPLVRANPEDARTMSLYERFLSVAVGTFGKREFAYEYARLLQRSGRLREAIRYFQMVPANDSRRVGAQFYQALAMSRLLDDDRADLSAAQRAPLVAQASALAEQVRRELAPSAPSAPSAASAPSTAPGVFNAEQRGMLARITLLAAQLANTQQHDPRRCLSLLDGFERIVAGLPGESELLGEALFLRVDAYMDLNQATQATDALVALLNTREGAQGAQIIFGLLQKLDSDLDQARRSGDRQQMLLLARSRAQLSGYLVGWAASNANPRIRQFTYRYRVFDADTQHQAALLEDDPAARIRRLHDALERYQALQKPDAVAEYQQTIAGTDADPDYPDPAVMLGLGSVYFDLGDYANAHLLLGRLLADKKLGTEVRIVGGQPQDNDAYWQAMYELLRSNVELAKTDKSAAAALLETQRQLRFLYVRSGNAVGGRKWHAQFEQLRQQIIPDFKLQSLSTAPTQ